MRTSFRNGTATAAINVQDGLVNEDVLRTLDLVHERFGQRRLDLLARREDRKKALAQETVERFPDSVGMRSRSWSVAPFTLSWWTAGLNCWAERGGST
jgi:malate synthase